MAPLHDPAFQWDIRMIPINGTCNTGPSHYNGPNNGLYRHLGPFSLYGVHKERYDEDSSECGAEGFILFCFF